MSGWDVLKWGSLAIGGSVALGIAGRAVYRAGLRVYDDLSERWRKHQHDRLTLERIRDQNDLQRVREIKADEHGRFPLLLGLRGVLRDPNSLRSFTLTTVLERWPGLERLDWMNRQLIAMQGVSPANVSRTPELIEGTAIPVTWPEQITLQQALRGRQPSIEHLIVGAYPTATGLQVVADSLHNLMHVLEVGASGWGKSAWLRSFLYQVARAREPCEVVAIDVNGSEFNVLRGWGKLRYPVARTPNEAIAVLHQVADEIGQRKERYEQHPLATNLVEYNEASGADLPPWVVAIDEGTNLLNRRGIGEPLREAVQTARQYGVYVLLAGQSAKHSVIDTQIRDQFSTRLCFRVSPTSSRVVLDDRAAGELHDKGRAWVQMVGCELQEIQGPWVNREDFLGALSNGGPRYQMPIVEEIAPPELEERGALGSLDYDQVLALIAEGQTPSAIAYEAFGYSNGNTVRKVQDWIAEHDDDDNDDDRKSTLTGVDGDDLSSSSLDGWCEFCSHRADDPESAGVEFKQCPSCGVTVCSECTAASGLCPDCEEHDKEYNRDRLR